MIIITGSMPRSGKLPVLHLLTGHNSGFFAPQGRLVAPIQFKLHRADGHLGSAWVCKISPESAQRGGNAAPKISQISTFW